MGINFSLTFIKSKLAQILSAAVRIIPSAERGGVRCIGHMWARIISLCKSESLPK